MRNFDAEREVKRIIRWIRHWYVDNGYKTTAVIGISGGKDSTIIAKLLVMALGKDHVYGVLMPNGEQADIDDAKKVVELLDIPYAEVNIKHIYDAAVVALQSANPFNVKDDVLINLPPRIRMMTLYGIAQGMPNGGRVVNTCNRSEDYIGYCTKYGDSAGDFAPCAHLTVTEMLAIGDYLGLPEELVHKTPSDGLCGKSDEDNFGFTYEELDNFIFNVTEWNPVLTPNANKIKDLHDKNIHKMTVVPNVENTYCPPMIPEDN